MDNNIQAEKQGIPVMLVAQPVQDEGLSLFEIWSTLLRHKLLIVGCIGATTMIGALYALLATPVFKSETLLAPPTVTDITPLAIAGSTKTPDEIFEDFGKNLTSKAIRNDFFLQPDVISRFAPEAKTERQLLDATNSFNNSLTYSDKGYLTMQGSDAALIAETLNEFVRFAARKTLNETIADLDAKKLVDISNLEHSIDLMKRNMAQGRLDQIQQRLEALGVAQKLGIHDFRLPIAGNPVKTNESDSVSFSAMDSPLYLRGTKALQEEIRVLRERKNDAIFGSELRDLEGQLLELKSQKIKVDTIKVVEVDETAIATYRPEKPKRKPIVLGSIILGFLLGIVAASIAESSPKRRDKALLV